MGSQGDAGQFRTPRHIIDMIVEIVEPRKTDTILDPACGTAGFLISAYKHILAKNIDDNSKVVLSPDDRKKLTNNIVGYDISPDMVRLSRVNMYLHNFPDPNIHIYDTLTNLSRWDDTFDVILANPPFMTPKGGINPHTRFRVQARRSEVLFVDYIAEHLNPNGKAGIIVPEGIVFQTSNAYKNLRKMLIEDDYLYAVISLPAGVFNPYSGVKTSILLFDRTIAKSKDNILFVKISNDGYDLGAQRREIINNDIPRTIEILDSYKQTVLQNEDFELSEYENEFAVIASKDEIIEKDSVLVGERYKKVEANKNIKWDMVELGQVATLMTGGTPRSNVKENYENGDIAWLVSGDIHKGFINECEGRITEKGLESSNTKYLPVNSVLIALNGQGKTRGTVALLKMSKATCNQSLVSINPLDRDKLSSDFLYYQLKSMYEDIRALTGNSHRSGLNMSLIRSIKILLPPLSIQQEIVEEIEGYQKIIYGARMVVDNYKPIIKISPEWEMVELGQVCDITSSKRIYQDEYTDEGIPFYRTKEIVELSKGNAISLELFISENRYYEIKSKFDVPKKGDILISAVGTIGITWIIPNNSAFYFKDGNLIWIKQSNKLNPEFLGEVIKYFVDYNITNLANGVAYKALTIVKLKQMKIPIPSIEIQRDIANKIGREKSIINANKELIEMYEQKIKEKISEIWENKIC